MLKYVFDMFDPCLPSSTEMGELGSQAVLLADHVLQLVALVSIPLALLGESGPVAQALTACPSVT